MCCESDSQRPTIHRPHQSLPACAGRPSGAHTNPPDGGDPRGEAPGGRPSPEPERASTPSGVHPSSAWDDDQAATRPRTPDPQRTTAGSRPDLQRHSRGRAQETRTPRRRGVRVHPQHLSRAATRHAIPVRGVPASHIPTGTRSLAVSHANVAPLISFFKRIAFPPAPLKLASARLAAASETQATLMAWGDQPRRSVAAGWSVGEPGEALAAGCRGACQFVERLTGCSHP